MSSSAAPQGTDLTGNPFLVAAGRGAPQESAHTPVTSNPLLVPASGKPTDNDTVTQDVFFTARATQERPPAQIDGNDPFLTHARPPAVADPHGREVVQDPFLTGAGPTRQGVEVAAPQGRVMEKVSKDPFLVSDSPTTLPKEGAAHFCVRKTSRQCQTFGGWCFGCTGRRCEFGSSVVHHVWAELVLWPWLLLLTVVMLQVVTRGQLQWVARTLCWFLVVALAVGGRSFPTVRRMQLRLILAVIAGVFIGQWVYEQYARQYWWMHEGVQYDSPQLLSQMPASARADAAWIRFSVGNDNASDVRVDTNRSAGYRNGDIWCVAPILSEEAVATSVYPLVEYWAIGKGCCESTGDFSCDDSQKYSAEYGVPVVGGWTEWFTSAATKAGAVYGMVSSEGSMPVRFVEDPKAFRSSLGEDIFRFIALLAFISFFVFYVLAIFESAMALALPDYGEKANLIAAAAMGPRKATKESMKRAYTNHMVLGVAVMLAVGLAAIMALGLGMMGTAVALIVVLVCVIFLLATVSVPEKEPKLVAVEKAGGGPGFHETLEHGGYGSSQNLAGGGGGGGAAGDFLFTAALHQQLHS